MTLCDFLKNMMKDIRESAMKAKPCTHVEMAAEAWQPLMGSF